jgi:hypothetical protein
LDDEIEIKLELLLRGTEEAGVFGKDAESVEDAGERRIGQGERVQLRL